MKRDPLKANVLAAKIIPNASPEMLKDLDIPADYKSLALITADSDDVTYTALDEATKNQLAQGERIREILKQPNYKPMPVEYQIVIIFAATKKLLLDVPTDKVLEFQDKLFRFIESKHPEIAAEIRDKKEISDDLAKRLTDVINECKKA